MPDDLLSDIVDESIEGKPEPSEFADKLIEEQEHVETGGNGEGVTPSGSSSGTASGFASDRISEVFDPQIHAVGPDGEPRRNKDGSYRRRKGFRSVAVQPSPIVTGPTPGCREAAKVTVNTIVILGQITFGDEWKPLEVEVDMMVQAWTDYFNSQGLTAFPPWLGVCMATGAYALPRLGKPKTRSKLGTAWNWLKGKLWYS